MLIHANHASLSDLTAASKHIDTSECSLPKWLGRIPSAVPEIGIWQAYLDAGTTTVLQCRNVLSSDERLRADRFHYERDRRRFTMARATLRILVGSYLNRTPASITFGYAKYGKPSVEQPAVEFYFNVSHSEERALYAISGDYPVGADIEYLNRDIEHDRLAQRFFTPNEWAALQQLPDSTRKRAFFACWTRKEAIVKAIGDGLSLPLDQVAVPITPATAPNVLGFAPVACDVANCALYSARLDSDYIAAVATYRYK